MQGITCNCNCNLRKKYYVVLSFFMLRLSRKYFANKLVMIRDSQGNASLLPLTTINDEDLSQVLLIITLSTATTIVI